MNSDKQNEVSLSGWSIRDLSFWRTSFQKHSSSEEQLNTLTLLYRLNTNIAFVMFGEKHNLRNSFVGCSKLVGGRAAKRVREAREQVCAGFRLENETINSTHLRSMLLPFANNIGTGRFLRRVGSVTSEQPPSLLSKFKSSQIGIMVLATPVPERHVLLERSQLIDQIERSSYPIYCDQQKVQNFIEGRTIYLQSIDEGARDGQWLVQLFFFATGTAVFEQLQTQLESGPLCVTNRSVLSFHTEVIEGLWQQLENYSLIQNMSSEGVGLACYRFLSPLNSRELLAVITNLFSN